ncbi:hypothetical protein [Flavobacterium sp.]|uniref:hypothetical protein n=1 Tax=Flavobacterium sp. TaxID=239 RepID=UPI00120B644D|nr:hypothetical protein [Flavobacterium sp.]RZJ73290.1 MAG: hypothetical protein EOO49_02995 [Flavobacterium sp.]
MKSESQTRKRRRKVTDFAPTKTIAATLALTTICCTNQEKRFASKTQIGLCQQTQGMIAYEVKLYSDSTFYLPPDEAFIDESYGKFHIEKDTVFFETKSAESDLCATYFYDRSKQILVPIDCSDDKFRNDRLSISLRD